MRSVSKIAENRLSRSCLSNQTFQVAMENAEPRSSRSLATPKGSAFMPITEAPFLDVEQSAHLGVQGIYRERLLKPADLRGRGCLAQRGVGRVARHVQHFDVRL